MASPNEHQDDLGSLIIALRIVAGLMVLGALYVMGTLLVPFVLALILAIALSPVAARLERAGLARGLASLICMLAVAMLLAVAVGLVAYQARSMVRDSHKYVSEFGRLLAKASKSTGGDNMMESLGLLRGGDGKPESDPARYWDNVIRQNAQALGRWVASGIGGILGCLGGVVILLAFLFYMLRTREDWVERIRLSTARLGLRPRGDQLAKVQHEIVTYLGCVSLVALGYAVIVTVCLWAIGVPQPLLWGLLAGLLELVPYFGPLIASVLPTIVTLSLPHWWQPALVFGQFVALHTLDGYVVTPQLYGKAIKIDPVSLLFGILFFGWLWGPLGLAAAMPVMILLRGLVSISPDTPALDALVDDDVSNK